jgi:hypothetical protein
MPAPRALPLLVLALAALLAPACSPSSAPGPAAAAPPAGGVVVDPPPPALERALEEFRAEGPRGWGFVQTTVGRGEDRVERHEPLRRGGERWTLVSLDGRTPTEEEQTRYRATRPAWDASSGMAEQLDRSTVWRVASDAETATYEFRLRPADEKDVAAPHMRARMTLHLASGAITRAELFNVEPIKPARSLTILEARTVVEHTPPADGRPALPERVTMHVRGRRFWVSEFEETVVSTFTEHVDQRPAAP